jgi:hypothetical protein
MPSLQSLSSPKRQRSFLSGAHWTGHRPAKIMEMGNGVSLLDNRLGANDSYRNRMRWERVRARHHNRF